MVLYDFAKMNAEKSRSKCSIVCLSIRLRDAHEGGSCHNQKTQPAITYLIAFHQDDNCEVDEAALKAPEVR